MAIYFTSKSRLITKAVNLSIAKKFTPKWRTVHTANALATANKNAVKAAVNHHQQSHHANHRGNGGGGGAGGQGSNRKGNLCKLKSLPTGPWTWKAGAGWTILSVLDWWLLVAGGWLSWQGVILRWTPLGVCLAAAIQWHLHNRELDRKGLPRTATQWQTNVYCSLPLRLFSRAWGWMADRRIPIPLRPMVYGTYCTAFGVNLHEALDSDLKNYRSISEFFTRSLKPGTRLIADDCSIVSPADGKVLYFGLANEDAHIEQVKGVSYSLQAFLGQVPVDINNNNNINSSSSSSSDNQMMITSGGGGGNSNSDLACNNAEDGDSIQSDRGYVKAIKQRGSADTALYQCVIYLAPGDYHRFHSPAEWQPKVRRHFVGELLSVSPRVAKFVPGLFCLNERALYMGDWEHGFFSLTAVGATNVGSVKIYIDEELKTNKWVGLQVGRNKRLDYDERVLPKETRLEKGQILGQFNMGSTIVLIFEAPTNFKFTIEAGQKIYVGQTLGHLMDTTTTAADANKSSQLLS